MDTCAVGDACAPSLTKITISTPSLSVIVPSGAYVTARVINAMYNNGHIQATVAVRNLASWNAMPNPISTVEHWYLLASEGALANPEAPFEAKSKALDCPTTGDGKLYELSFQEAGGPATVVPFGKIVQLNMAGQSWEASVIRSFEPFGSDYPIPYAWWFALGK